MTKVQAFVYKTFKEFNNNLYLWKNEITTTKKNKIFNISVNKKRLICMLFMGLLSSKLPYIYFSTPFLLIRMAYPAFLKTLNAFWMLEIHA